MTKSLFHVIDGLKGERVGFHDAPVKGITCDSRRVEEGFVFVAVPGDKLDGREFIAHAVQRGASAIVGQEPLAASTPLPTLVVEDARAALAEIAARFYDHPSRRLNVVGITGTKGKSTTAYLLRAIHETAGERVGLIGTIQVAIGSRVQAASMTTPPAEDLQKYLLEMADAGCRTVVMEASSHALAQERTRAIRFAAGIFTNLQHDHLDYHKTRDDYRAAKARLFRQLSENSIAVLNADDPEAEFYADQTAAHVVQYGIGGRKEVRASIERTSFRGTSVRLTLGTETVALRSRLIGRHNVYNMLAAAASAWAMGYDLEPIKAGLENCAGVPGRLEAVDAGQDFAVVVDYAHTTESLQSVLEALRPLTQGRLILVFGCGGDRDRAKRPRMGRVAEEGSDFFIITSDNPRREDPMGIIREIEGGTINYRKHLVESDRSAAIKVAIGMAHGGDTVLIAGKGHEPYQICGDETRAFDDRAVAREILDRTVRTKRE